MTHDLRPTSIVGFTDLVRGVPCALCSFAPPRRIDARIVSEIAIYTLEQPDVDRLAKLRRTAMLQEPHFLVTLKDSTQTSYPVTLSVPMPRFNPFSGGFLWNVCMDGRGCRSACKVDWDMLSRLVVELLGNTELLPETVLPRLKARP